jgi:hypothetical protein
MPNSLSSKSHLASKFTNFSNSIQVLHSSKQTLNIINDNNSTVCQLPSLPTIIVAPRQINTNSKHRNNNKIFPRRVSELR